MMEPWHGDGEIAPLESLEDDLEAPQRIGWYCAAA